MVSRTRQILIGDIISILLNSSFRFVLWERSPCFPPSISGASEKLIVFSLEFMNKLGHVVFLLFFICWTIRTRLHKAIRVRSHDLSEFRLFARASRLEFILSFKAFLFWYPAQNVSCIVRGISLLSCSLVYLSFISFFRSFHRLWRVNNLRCHEVMICIHRVEIKAYNCQCNASNYCAETTYSTKLKLG